MLRAWRVARCAVRSTRDSESNARRRRAGAHCARRVGACGIACARVMSRRRAMVRCCRWRIGRRTTCCVRNVRAHRAVRPRCGRVRVCGAKRALCGVRSAARKVLRAPRVAKGAARSARGPKASARRRRVSCPLRRAASARCGCAGARWRAEARNVLRAKRGAQSVVCVVCYALCGAMAGEPEASVRRRWAGESVALRLAGRCGCVVCARVMSRRRVMLRIGRRAKRTAHNVRRAWCAAHRAGRSARGPEASARRRRAEGPAASRRAGVSWCACVWVGAACEAWGAPVAHCAVR